MRTRLARSLERAGARPGARPGAWACLLALALGLAACGAGPQTGFVATNAPPRAMSARPVAEVAVLEGEPPAYPHVEVGIVEVLGGDGWGAAERAALRDELRRRAAERGCDAVVVLGEIDWIYVVESSSSAATRHGYRGVCVVRR